jgi:small-conductance mechanosensitive channel
LPTRHFFEKFSDSLRVWVNETSTPQEDVRNGIDAEIKNALRSEGIDIRNKTMTVPMAR